MTLGRLGLLIVLTAGCAAPVPTGPSQQQISEVLNAHYGTPPQDFKQHLKIAEQQVRPHLKDPWSLKLTRYETVPKRCAVNISGTRTYGHCYVYYYNAKNSYGGYVGDRLTVLFFNSEGTPIPLNCIPNTFDLDISRPTWPFPQQTGVDRVSCN